MSLSLQKFQANKVVPVALPGEPSDVSAVFSESFFVAFDGRCCWDRTFACCFGSGEFMTSCFEGN